MGVRGMEVMIFCCVLLTQNAYSSAVQDLLHFFRGSGRVLKMEREGVESRSSVCPN